MLRLAFLIVGLSLLGLAGVEAFRTLDFVQQSVLVTADVVDTSFYQGPPRSPASESLRVKFNSSDGLSHELDIGAPFLKQYERGTTVPLLVRKDDPSKVRLPFLAELWKWPCIHAFFGLALTVATFVRKKRPPFRLPCNPDDIQNSDPKLS